MFCFRFVDAMELSVRIRLLNLHVSPLFNCLFFSFLLFNIYSVCDKQLYVNIFKTSLHISTHIVEIKKKNTQLRKNSNRWHSCSRRNIMFIGNRLHLLYLVVNRLLVLHQILDIRKYKMVISNISHFKTIRKPIKTCENPLNLLSSALDIRKISKFDNHSAERHFLSYRFKFMKTKFYEKAKSALLYITIYMQLKLLKGHSRLQ